MESGGVFDSLRCCCVAWDGVSEERSWGGLAWKVRDVAFALADEHAQTVLVRLPLASHYAANDQAACRAICGGETCWYSLSMVADEAWASLDCLETAYRNAMIETDSNSQPV